MQRRVLLTFLSTLCFLVATSGALVAGKNKPRHDGGYEITFSGDWNGVGKATVNATSVSIDCKATDLAKKTVHIKAQNLAMDKGRFHGDGLIDGKAVRLSGRVEESFVDNDSRISGTISDVEGGKFGRFSAVRKGDGKDKGKDKDDDDD